MSWLLHHERTFTTATVTVEGVPLRRGHRSLRRVRVQWYLHAHHRHPCTANYDHLSHTEWAISGAGDDPVAKLIAGVRAYVEYIVANRSEALVAHTEVRYLDEEHRKRLVVARDRIDDMLQKILAEGVATGAFSTPYPREVTRAILTMCAGVAQWYRPDGSLTGDEIADRYAQLALAMTQDPTPLRA